MEEKESKFNFTEDANPQEKVDKNKAAVKQEAKSFFESIRLFLHEIFNFRDDTDRDATIEAIKNDIPFKGATAWILICSVFVASIGLNANSTAVVIGAMLISPLMGPILGIGMSIAINDIDTLRKSFVNFAVMIVLSVVTAFLFFRFFPLKAESSELLARTAPDIRDVLIAFFGGLGLIIARTKKGTIASVIFGVAIATALMPPLCTVGYGLAVAFLDTSKGLGYALGALYLFTINSIFIALATFIVLKLLRFPMLKYANSAKRKRIARLASLVAIIAMIPAGFTFISVLNKSNFDADASTFLAKELTALPHSEFMKRNATYDYVNRDNSSLTINTFGLDEIPESSIAMLEAAKKEYSALVNTKLIINQNKNKNLDNFRYMKQLRSRDSMDLLSQSQKISFLEDKIQKLSKLERDAIPFEIISKEVHINYQNIDNFSYATVIRSNFKAIDTITEFSVKWNTKIEAATVKTEKDKLQRWLKERLQRKNVVVKMED